MKKISLKFIPMLKVLDLGLGKLVSSVHGREVFSIKTSLKFVPMLKV